MIDIALLIIVVGLITVALAIDLAVLVTWLRRRL
jgi:hypothetical protein